MNNRQVEWLVALILVMAPVAMVRAQPDKTQQNGQPSLEVLEFLGFWETPGGELIDPLTLRREPEAARQAGEPQQSPKEKKAQQHE